MEIAVTDYVQPDLSLERRIAAEHGLSLREPERACTSEDELIAFVGAAEAVIAQQAPFTRGVMEALPKLRIISLPQIGTDAVDLPAANDLGVWVTNVPDANITEVASHAAAMALALARRLPLLDAAVRSGTWEYAAAGPLLRPAGMTVGALGLGRIGRLFAAYVTPCFGEVVAYDPYVDEGHWPAGVTRLHSLGALLERADILSLHMPLSDATANLINRTTLAQMKPGAILINVSRGPIVDLPALLEALDRGHLAYAGLDVLPTEPPRPGDPVLTHPRVLLSPHAAFYSEQSDTELRRRSVETIAAFVRTGQPDDIVVRGHR